MNIQWNAEIQIIDRPVIRRSDFGHSGLFER